MDQELLHWSQWQEKIASKIAPPKMDRGNITGKNPDNNPYHEPSNINIMPPELTEGKNERDKNPLKEINGVM